MARADGVPAYQLAVVVDDAAMAVTDVVRGDDLLPSTGRQLLLYRALGLAPPRFAHVPLVVGEDGVRLAKRHGALSLGELRERGADPRAVVGLLAELSGLAPPGALASPRELVARVRAVAPAARAGGARRRARPRAGGRVRTGGARAARERQRPNAAASSASFSARVPTESRMQPSSPG